MLLLGAILSQLLWETAEETADLVSLITHSVNNP